MVLLRIKDHTIEVVDLVGFYHYENLILDYHR